MKSILFLAVILLSSILIAFASLTITNYTPNPLEIGGMVTAVALTTTTLIAIRVQAFAVFRIFHSLGPPKKSVRLSKIRRIFAITANIVHPNVENMITTIGRLSPHKIRPGMIV